MLPGKLHQLLELMLELGFYALEAVSAAKFSPRSDPRSETQEDLPGLLLELQDALALAQVWEQLNLMAEMNLSLDYGLFRLYL